ncbi:hypothetical protein [Acidithiobacillus ferrivorans]|uniref:hypothetical protein n=1 Tax=Acidithiobacillus ferrivorans TaxID=160808 RepID=UPI001146136C|nr:hypothetical protein [Acidithiobacillus ferrivorans]
MANHCNSLEWWIFGVMGFSRCLPAFSKSHSLILCDRTQPIGAMGDMPDKTIKSALKAELFAADLQDQNCAGYSAKGHPRNSHLNTKQNATLRLDRYRFSCR